MYVKLYRTDNEYPKDYTGISDRFARENFIIKAKHIEILFHRKIVHQKLIPFTVKSDI